MIEVTNKKPVTEIQTFDHLHDVTQLALNHIGGLVDRQLAIIDANRELFLISIRSSGFGRVCKIGKLDDLFI